MNLLFFNQTAQLFLKKIAYSLAEENIQLEDHWHVDHLCYRVATAEEYEQNKKDFLEFSEFLIESPVNGRLISTFKLFKPLPFLNWQIDLVELPAPKPGKPSTTGFEHIEVVCDIDFRDLRKKFPQADFDDSALSKDFNRELKIQLSKVAVKFHHLSLESVVRLESNKPVFESIRKLNVLKDFAKLSPLIAGTFPLGIATPTSDVDILMSSQDLPSTKEQLIEKFSLLPNFKIEESPVLEEPTLIVSFIFMNIPFEIFVQSTPSIRQRGYLHFLIEERLLKMGGEKFISAIRDLRARGLKTEPAFAQVLGLKGDPYLALLDLQKVDEATLLKIK